jgi:hypothetical protein
MSQYWVVPHGDGWAVRTVARLEPLTIRATKSEALEAARLIAGDSGSEIVVQERAS